MDEAAMRKMMELNDRLTGLEKSERAKVAWHFWFNRDMLALSSISANAKGLMFHRILLGIAAWGVSRHSMARVPKQRFLSICTNELSFSPAFAELLYTCKRGFENVGVWPDDIALITAVSGQMLGVVDNPDDGVDVLVINVIALANRVLTAMKSNFPASTNGHFKYPVSVAAGAKATNVIAELRTGGIING